MALPGILTILITVLFLIVERAYPARSLPPVQGWYLRALGINAVQLIISLLTMRLWKQVIGFDSVLNLATWNLPIAEGFVGWLVGTFVFYWWHRIRHLSGFWLMFHQLHHSPSRIEIATSFYKHPIEIFVDALLSGSILYALLGCSIEGAYW